MRAIVSFAALCATGAAITAAALMWWPETPQITDLPETVAIPAGSYNYRPSGDFRIGTRSVDPPSEQRSAGTGFEIMKYPVSEAQYALCVAAEACNPTATTGQADAAQIDISYVDATGFARWYSKMTRQTWRLPTDDEWVRAAGDRYVDSGLGISANETDPSKRWLANYRQMLTVRGDTDTEIHQRGHFGDNEFGVSDMAGNVWEWTESCFVNGQLSADGSEITEQTSYCGVRAVQGKHRAFIIDFVRDAKVGGCAAGIPPDYLGFRLVREG
ncbi:formylglycine-generating enzyme family protein [Parasedimentitalea marina]|nr:SUMF1/EgtB/PvdO family nonheme iron enzyme [Parasedimentitalea marina]